MIARRRYPVSPNLLLIHLYYFRQFNPYVRVLGATLKIVDAWAETHQPSLSWEIVDNKGLTNKGSRNLVIDDLQILVLSSKFYCKGKLTSNKTL